MRSESDAQGVAVFTIPASWPTTDHRFRVFAEPVGNEVPCPEWQEVPLHCPEVRVAYLEAPTLCGIVRDSKGLPLACDVVLVGADSGGRIRVLAEGQCAEDGSYRLAPTACHDQMALAACDEGHPLARVPVSATDVCDGRRIDVLLRPASLLKLRLLDTGGLPVPDAVITVQSWNPLPISGQAPDTAAVGEPCRTLSRAREYRTDTDGCATVDGWAAGDRVLIWRLRSDDGSWSRARIRQASVGVPVPFLEGAVAIDLPVTAEVWLECDPVRQDVVRVTWDWRRDDDPSTYLFVLRNAQGTGSRGSLEDREGSTVTVRFQLPQDWRTLYPQVYFAVRDRETGAEKAAVGPLSSNSSEFGPFLASW